MSLVLFSDLVPEIMEVCQQAPEPSVERAVRDTVIELARVSGGIRRNPDPITLQVNQAEYRVPIDDGYRFKQIVTAQINDYAPMVQASVQQLDMWWAQPIAGPLQFDRWSQIDNNNGSSWRQLQQSSPQAFYVRRADNDVFMRLVGIPSVQLPNALAVTVALYPDQNATGADQWFVQDNWEAIKNGAKFRMLAIPKRPWSDAPTAAYYSELFEQDKEDIRIAVARDHIKDDESVGHVRSWV